MYLSILKPLAPYFLLLSMAFSFSSSWQQKDAEWLHAINQSRYKALDTVYIVVSKTAGPLAIGLPLLLLAVSYAKRSKPLRRKTIFLIISVASAAALTNILKYLINRPRPFDSYEFIEKLGSAGSPSFPSGHTSDAFALAMALSLAFPRWPVVIISFFWAALMAYTRMSLGVHYPSDVVAGAAIGVISAVSAFLFLRFRWTKKQSNNS